MINPLQFMGNTQLADINAPISKVDTQTEFLRLFIQQVFLKNFKLSLSSPSENNDEESFWGGSSNQQSSMMTDLFKQQFADEIMKSSIFNLDSAIKQRSQINLLLDKGGEHG